MSLSLIWGRGGTYCDAPLSWVSHFSQYFSQSGHTHGGGSWDEGNLVGRSIIAARDFGSAAGCPQMSAALPGTNTHCEPAKPPVWSTLSSCVRLLIARRSVPDPRVAPAGRSDHVP